LRNCCKLKTVNLLWRVGPTMADPLRTAIQSQHPGLPGELQQAIQTLQKLQRIAGGEIPLSPPPPADLHNDNSSATILTSSGVPGDTEATFISDAPQTSSVPDRAAALAAGEAFGRYQIIRMLGRGAMGAVYLAYDGQLDRHVAIKTPFFGGNTETSERFYREARAAAQLRSPNICPIYDVGQHAGIHYMSMAFIDGRSLGEMIKSGELRDTTPIARTLRGIASGLQKAHEKGIVHRDLKPDNIMVDADQVPVIMDFGLARQAEDDAGLSTPGRLLGTPAYMSPEQAAGDHSQAGPSMDIYSLGVVLYEMLTGTIPFKGSIMTVLQQIACSEPPKPSTINPDFGEDSPLERLCLRMMSKAPKDRPAAAQYVVDELDLLLQGGNQDDAPKPHLWTRLLRRAFRQPIEPQTGHPR
jgi:serine/threonine protein kinase